MSTAVVILRPYAVRLFQLCELLDHYPVHITLKFEKSKNDITSLSDTQHGSSSKSFSLMFSVLLIFRIRVLAGQRGMQSIRTCFTLKGESHHSHSGGSSLFSKYE